MSAPNDCIDRQVSGDHGPGCQCEVWLDPMKFNIPVTGQMNTIKLSDLKPPRDPFAEFLTDLRDRVLAIEARQRAYGQHDPACPRLLDDQAQAKTDWLMGKRDCDCWLSREAS